jgi:hypothetical protein
VLHALGGSGEDLWAVGDGGALLRREARGWTRVTSPTQQALHALWVNGPGDAWALGAAGTALHWDGAAWSQVPTGVDGTFLKAWGSGPSDVWAVATYEEPIPGGSNWRRGSRVYRWDGRVWARVEVPAGDAVAVWGRGPGDVWVAGQHEGTPWLWRWDGQRGALLPLPDDASTLSLASLWGTADHLFVAGRRGLPVHGTEPWRVLRWDGTGWTELPVTGSQWGAPAALQGTRDGRLWLGGGDALLRQQAQSR